MLPGRSRQDHQPRAKLHPVDPDLCRIKQPGQPGQPPGAGADRRRGGQVRRGYGQGSRRTRPGRAASQIVLIVEGLHDLDADRGRGADLAALPPRRPASVLPAVPALPGIHPTGVAPGDMGGPQDRGRQARPLEDPGLGALRLPALPRQDHRRPQGGSAAPWPVDPGESRGASRRALLPSFQPLQPRPEMHLGSPRRLVHRGQAVDGWPPGLHQWKSSRALGAAGRAAGAPGDIGRGEARRRPPVSDRRRAGRGAVPVVGVP